MNSFVINSSPRVLIIRARGRKDAVPDRAGPGSSGRAVDVIDQSRRLDVRFDRAVATVSATLLRQRHFPRTKDAIPQAINGGTAFPIWRNLSPILPKKRKSSGKTLEPRRLADGYRSRLPRMYVRVAVLS